jgi:hypothetical protein
VVSVTVEPKTGNLLINLQEFLLGISTPLMVGTLEPLLLKAVEKVANPCTTVLFTPLLLKATVSPTKPET